jgi:hypothetical protein
MKSIHQIIFVSLLLSLSACASIEIPGAISTHDLNQAAIIRDWLAQEPKLKGRYTVNPKPDEVIVRFQDDLPEGRTPVFTERLAEVKAAMFRDLKKPVNTLVFIFPSQTIKI